MKRSNEELKAHVENAHKVYLQELGAPEGAFWIMHPRDYHLVGSLFPIKKNQTNDLPEFLKLPTVVAHVWRQLPLIALNVNALQTLIDLNHEQEKMIDRLAKYQK